MKLAEITSVYRAKLIAKTYRTWLEKDMKVLDVGCGTGIVGNVLSKNFGFKIIGCDIDRYLLTDITYQKMKRSDKIPFKNASFDTAMFNDVLHHTNYKNQENLILEAIRVANKVTVFELKTTYIGKFLDYMLNKIHNPKMKIPYTYRSEEGWEEMFMNLNLKFKKLNFKRPIFYPFSHIVYILTK